MSCKETITVYSENQKQPINIICWQNAGLLNIETFGTHNYY
jgi:hypothetical protein